MTTTLATPTVEERLDALTAQVARLAAAVEDQERSRQARADLVEELNPVARDAMVRISTLLDERDIDVAATGALLLDVLEALPRLERGLHTLVALSELGDELSPIANDAMRRTIDALAIADERGYVDFAKAGVGVVERIMTHFDEGDVEALGDNVVTMLEVVRDLTQPQMLAVAKRMVDAVERQQTAIAAEPAEPPGLFALLRKLRDPEVRRGLARALDTLKVVTEETTPVVRSNTENRTRPTHKEE